ncbi:ImmA/IrrE family metallo-endopeptidase [Fumia xinanensis]|uniref:ImmA/IrrE family metallo-endopeptidase n=1 Tax=Fumia xinanensis TaxID=2763659 RepID=A0A926I6H4_9FIRM|nr:ImmA/IrrE family metallo-endopeptidase [Fumia xinanensis]MBC8558856.1 ImmA/IrrE family metallo-endopeptidase [Fumia xinanensis]
MDYEEYKISRDLAWKIILDMGFTELPIKVSAICRKLGIQVRSYEKAKKLLKRHQLEHKTLEIDGFTLGIDGRYTILFNEHCSIQRNRFTVAHELGHILLGHVPKDGIHITAINREPSSKDNPLEQQANVFASRLMAPLCVLKSLRINDAKDIARLCDISETAAQFRFNRLKLINEREQHKSCYGLSPLEMEVLEQFRPYIESHML